MMGHWITTAAVVGIERRGLEQAIKNVEVTDLKIFLILRGGHLDRV